MKAFMNRDFLLTTDTARTLYHDYAADCPIIDYHNHLDPREIYECRRYENLTQLWLEADHYKWRAMRVCGVEEHYVTGNASEYEKFEKFAAIMPRLVGSPVYHWAHLELQRYFGITTPLTAATAREIWDKTSAMLRSDGFDAVSLLAGAKVEVLCTTDDPADTLEWHMKLKEEGDLPFCVLPSFRPDRILYIDQNGWAAAVAQLGARYGRITDWDSLCAALYKSLDFFCEVGCRVTDHGFIHFRYGVGDPVPVMAKALRGEALTEDEITVYQGALMRFLAGEYHRRDLVMQMHLGPIRNNSAKLMASFGPDAGGDSVGSTTDPFLLSAFLGDLDRADALPKTILYNLNPADNGMVATMAVNFAADGAKVQYGAAWWFSDHIRGICAQLDQLMETGLLSGSVGMLTDSRAFTSFVRHEYFRRILCAKLGDLVEQGQYPCDVETLGELVRDVCHRNAERYFGF